MLDVVSLGVALGVLGVYWAIWPEQPWILNDFMAVCTIVTAVKIFKIRSLRDGTFMLFSLLLIEVVLSLFIHYILKQSFNNLVIKLFESPLVLVFPSITPELYRRCAWLPLTSIVFPGLFISYLRRVDKCKGTCLYLLIGYMSFYLGSMLWMLADMGTPHTLPLGLISDVVTVGGVMFFANRRNELRTLW